MLFWGFCLIQPLTRADESIPINTCVTPYQPLSITNNHIAQFFSKYDLSQQYQTITTTTNIADTLTDSEHSYHLYTEEQSFIELVLQSESPDLYLYLQDATGNQIPPLNTQYANGILTQWYPVQTYSSYLIHIEGTGIYELGINAAASSNSLYQELRPGIIYEGTISEPELQLFPLQIYNTKYISITFSGEDTTIYPELLNHCYKNLPVQITEYGRQSFSQVYMTNTQGMYLLMRGHGDYQIQLNTGDNLREFRGIIPPETRIEGRSGDTGEIIALYHLQTESDELQIEVAGQYDEIMLHDTTGRLIYPDSQFFEPESRKNILTYSTLSDTEYTLTILADFFYELIYRETITQSPESEPEICTVRPYAAVNQRGGPGLNYDVINVLTETVPYPVVAQATDNEGYIWWQLENNESWVRSDVIALAGDCDEIPVINP